MVYDSAGTKLLRGLRGLSRPLPKIALAIRGASHMTAITAIQQGNARAAAVA